jgi:hypothetical protein
MSTLRHPLLRNQKQHILEEALNDKTPVDLRCVSGFAEGPAFFRRQ